MINKVSKVIVFLLLASVSILFYTCSSARHTGAIKNIASTYNPSASSIHPEFIVVHESDSISNLYVKINPKELLFNSANSSTTNKATLKIHYKIYSNFNIKSYVDSATVKFNFTNNISNEFFISYFPIKVPSGQKYNIEIVSTDINRGSSNLLYININKEDVFSSQNFLVTDNENNTVFVNYFDKQKGIRLENKRRKGNDIFVAYFKPDNETPNPVFSVIKEKNTPYKPDTTWVWSNTDDSFFYPEKAGIYLFRADTTSHDGVTFMYYNDFFPRIKTTNELLKPLRYLLSSKEYNRMDEFENKKLAVDSFWLATSGNTYRSKELIRVYYSRVFYANKYFTSFTEGWLTDRGMVYTVFGPPKTIYKSDDGERWIYGLSNNLSSMDFYFYRGEHPFCNNHYVLNRQEIYKGSWYQAVDTWRNGRVYSVLN